MLLKLTINYAYIYRIVTSATNIYSLSIFSRWPISTFVRRANCVFNRYHDWGWRNSFDPVSDVSQVTWVRRQHGLLLVNTTLAT